MQFLQRYILSFCHTYIHPFPITVSVRTPTPTTLTPHLSRHFLPHYHHYHLDHTDHGHDLTSLGAFVSGSAYLRPTISLFSASMNGLESVASHMLCREAWKRVRMTPSPRWISTMIMVVRMRGPVASRGFILPTRRINCPFSCSTP